MVISMDGTGDGPESQPLHDGGDPKIDFQDSQISAALTEADINIDHLEKMSDYKSCVKGLMDIALLSANANQLRHAVELSPPFRYIMMGLLSLSILLQILASCLLVAERMTSKTRDYSRCHKYNVTIGIMVVLIIVVNILATAFGAPA